MCLLETITIREMKVEDEAVGMAAEHLAAVTADFRLSPRMTLDIRLREIE